MYVVYQATSWSTGAHAVPTLDLWSVCVVTSAHKQMDKVHMTEQIC